MLNAVIYARYSSDNQWEESIDAQLRICRRHSNHDNAPPLMFIIVNVKKKI